MKNVLFLAAGLAAGAVGGYFAAKKVLEKKYKAIADEEIASMESIYNIRLEKAKASMTAEQNAKIKSDISDTIIQKTEEFGKQFSAEESEIKHTGRYPYNRNIDAPEESKLVRKYATAVVADEKENRNTPPRIIDADIFVNDPEFDKISLTYYEGDEVLIEGDDIADIASTIGFDALDHFGERWDQSMGCFVETDEPDVVYVRNNRLKTCFEVMKEPGCWYESDVGPSED